MAGQNVRRHRPGLTISGRTDAVSSPQAPLSIDPVRGADNILIKGATDKGATKMTDNVWPLVGLGLLLFFAVR